eukprot:scaffold91854_cov18-Tisochrysis_lutea.AAC.1
MEQVPQEMLWIDPRESASPWQCDGSGITAWICRSMATLNLRPSLVMLHHTHVALEHAKVLIFKMSSLGFNDCLGGQIAALKKHGDT